MYKRLTIRSSGDFSAETFAGQREWHTIFKTIRGKKKKNPATKNTLPSKAIIQI